MTESFKGRTQKFVSDIMTDLKTSQPKMNGERPAVKHAEAEPQTYRDESRVSEFGKLLFTWNDIQASGISFVNLSTNYRLTIEQKILWSQYLYLFTVGFRLSFMPTVQHFHENHW